MDSHRGVRNHGLSEEGNSSNKSPMQIVSHQYDEFAHLRATFRESRAKLMMRGGLYDIGEQLCRMTLDIEEVIFGWEHPETGYSAYNGKTN